MKVNDWFRDIRALSPIVSWGVRMGAGALTILFLAYGIVMVTGAPSNFGVNSRAHGVGIIFLGALTGRYAVFGKTGLRTLDE